VQRLLGEDLRDESHVSEDGQPPGVGDRDPRRFLPPVLQREQAEVGDARHISLGRSDPEEAAHLDLAHFHGEVGDRSAGEDEAHGVRIGHVQLGLDVAPCGHLGKGGVEPAVGDVMNERQ
jgi:hypothetical protein